MAGKRPGPAKSYDPHATVQIVRSVWCEIFLVVGIIQSGPLLIFFVPPDQLLALAPRRSIRTRRRAVINNSAIVRPGKSPAMPEQIFRCPFVGAISVGLRKDSAIN